MDGQVGILLRPRRPDLAFIAVAALTVLAAVLRFARIGHQGFWFDEGNTALLVHFSPGQMLELIPHRESTPPLYYCLAWVWARIFGYGEAGLRSLSALAGVATVPIVYAAAAKLVSRRAGVIAAALAACNPFLVWYSQEARSYSLLVAFSALTAAGVRPCAYRPHAAGPGRVGPRLCPGPGHPRLRLAGDRAGGAVAAGAPPPSATAADRDQDRPLGDPAGAAGDSAARGTPPEQVQHYRDLLPLSLYLPGLRFMRRRGATVRELDVVSISPPRVHLCWWGAACKSTPIQRSYAIPDFHELWRRHSLQFTIVRLVSSTPVRVTLQAVSHALTTTTLRRDELLIQR